MKKGLYSRLAWTGIRKNRQLYLPYLLTCIGMVMMFYIIDYLAESPLLLQVHGGQTMKSILSLGRIVIGIFAVIFLFYTNSFLIRRRNREFGLYNILGMNKRNISRILLWETAIVAGISLICGLLLGILFSKLAELAMLKMVQAEANTSLSIAVSGLLETILIFAGIFLFLLFVSLARVRLSNPITLLRSESSGEKPPKANWILALIGLALLAAAYYLAVSIEDPISAMMWFFVAVVMVILATYCLFIAGSVVFCRLLQRNKRYYYKANHFVSVSSMVYRMKRNGAGLASICVLSTMVLVMIASTGSLFIGAEDALRSQFPQDFTVKYLFPSTDYCNEQNYAELRKLTDDAITAEKLNEIEYTQVQLAGILGDGSIALESDDYSYSDICVVYIMPLSDYNRLTGKTETLQKNEVLIYSKDEPYPYDTISIGETTQMKVKKASSFPDIYDPIIMKKYYMFVDNFASYVEGILSQLPEDERDIYYFDAFDVDVGYQTQADKTIAEITAAMDENPVFAGGEDDSYWIVSYAENKDQFYSLYGILFFLGILLSIVFVFAAVLIIYYKQISEGYEDQARFEIMQKVGMTKREIRRSISSQVLTVFFAPLVLAGVHLAFAFPIVWELIQCFGIQNLKLMIESHIGCFLIFTVLYAVVYRVTSNVYFGIVSGGRQS
ncbi:MAG: FtsX-like permease family protein [Clostridia bacterium]|nr:FtsX-like permease family protein [Clostridia bacterium]